MAEIEVGSAKDRAQVKRRLFNALKREGCFWSYDPKSVKLSNMTDEFLISLVLEHLDLDYISLLFILYPSKKIKRIWLDQIVPQGDYLLEANLAIAVCFFHVKRPLAYIKRMTTRHLNKFSYEYQWDN